MPLNKIIIYLAILVVKNNVVLEAFQFHSKFFYFSASHCSFEQSNNKYIIIEYSY